MTEKFEASKEFAEEWLEYKKIAVPTQETILIPAIKKSIKRTDIRILDLGCGDGELTGKMDVFHPIELIGLDINTSLLKIAKDRQIQNAKFDYCDLSSDKFSIKDNSIDIIISSNLLMHIDDFALNHTLQECKRVLKEDGEIYLFVTNFEWASNNYDLEQNNNYSYKSIRKVWNSNVTEYYRTVDFYQKLFSENEFLISEIIDLKIPNDPVLNIRYLSNVGLPLFTQFKLE